MSCPHCWPDAVPVTSEFGADEARAFVRGVQGYLAVEPQGLYWGDGEPYTDAMVFEANFCPWCGRDLSEVG